MNKKMQSLVIKNIFKIIMIFKDKKIISFYLIFYTKMTLNDNVTKHKMKLIRKEFQQ